MNEKEWLNNLKVGDSAFIASGYGRTQYLSAKVSKITKTQIVLCREGSNYTYRFRKDNGWQVGERGYNRNFLVEPTPNLLEDIREANLRSRVRRMLETITVPKDLAGLEALNAALVPFFKDEEKK